MTRAKRIVCSMMRLVSVEAPDGVICVVSDDDDDDRAQEGTPVRKSVFGIILIKKLKRRRQSNDQQVKTPMRMN